MSIRCSKSLVLVWICSFALMLPAGTASGEEALRVKAHASPVQATIGDEIRLTIKVEKLPGVTLEPLSPKMSLLPFEIKKIETLSSDRILLTLTTFELGELKIPPVVLHGQDKRGNPVSAASEEIPVKIVSVGKKPTDKDDIRPIKGPVSFNLRWFWNLGLGLLALLLAVLLAIKVASRIRKQRLLDQESLKPPHERAFLELGRLNKKEYLSQDKVKEHYSEFADILRRYLERRFAVETLELTTAEILEAFKKKNFNRPDLEKIKDILENADLVKFAKFTPSPAIWQRLSETLVGFVENTKPAPVEPRKK